MSREECRILSRLTKEYSDGGDFSRAFRTVGRIECELWRNLALRGIAMDAGQASTFDTAETATNQITFDRIRNDALETLRSDVRLCN